MSYGDTTYTPGSNITVIAECWGAGGKGRIGQSGGPWQGPGGGGGGYSRKAGIALTGGTGYLVRVGAPGGIAANHESLFTAVPNCKAFAGTNAGFHDPGAAGATTAGAVGDVKYGGGNGSAYPGDGSNSGGGGGSSGGRGGAGNTGAVSAGGADPGCGGKGGNGSVAGSGGQVGTAPGGGGGGGDTTFGSGGEADGAEGCVIIWEDLGNWPPTGQTPLYTAGTLPGCTFPPTPQRVYAFIM